MQHPAPWARSMNFWPFLFRSLCSGGIIGCVLTLAVYAITGVNHPQSYFIEVGIVVVLLFCWWWFFNFAFYGRRTRQEFEDAVIARMAKKFGTPTPEREQYWRSLIRQMET